MDSSAVFIPDAALQMQEMVFDLHVSTNSQVMARSFCFVLYVLAPVVSVRLCVFPMFSVGVSLMDRRRVFTVLLS